ncbi:MAG: hypothetical protein WAN21_09185 [Candidatus Sulfotelmatobacter sp.]
MLWFVLQLTGSGAVVGLVILCFDLPGVVTGAILGRLLDRYQPRLVMGFDNLVRAALIAAIPTLYALGSLQLWHVFVLALLAAALSPATTAGASWTPYTPMETTLLQRLVPGRDTRPDLRRAAFAGGSGGAAGSRVRWRAVAISLGAAGNRYLWPRLHPRRAGWPRLTVSASVATRKPLVFRQGMNTIKRFGRHGWVLFRVSVFISVHLWLRTNTETPPRRLHAPGINRDSRRPGSARGSRLLRI